MSRRCDRFVIISWSKALARNGFGCYTLHIEGIFQTLHPLTQSLVIIEKLFYAGMQCLLRLAGTGI